MNTEQEELKIAFFGTPQMAVYVLEELGKGKIIPNLIITAPDKPVGRKLILTPPPTKIWAEENFISVFQPETLKEENAVQAIKDEGEWDLFIVAAYGNMLPKEIIELPKYGILNVHPSLLPRLRGASPIQTAILEEDKTGVTIMLIDDEMDHGPIVAQEQVNIPSWPPKASKLEEILARRGGEILKEVIPKWVTGEIKAKKQNHDKATFTKKIRKEDGLIDLEDSPERNYKKIQSFDVWPRAYFFKEHAGRKKRVIITDATLVDGQLVIEKVIPEGKKKMSYKDFLNGS